MDERYQPRDVEAAAQRFAPLFEAAPAGRVAV